MFRRIILIQLLLTITVYCQIDVSTLSASVGVIRNLQPYDLYSYYSLYPEIEVGGNLLNSQTSWYLYLNYFDDNVTEIKPVRDLGIFYSYKVIGIGAQVGVTIIDSSTINFPLKISILGGASVNIIKGRNIIENLYLNPSNKKEIYDHIYNLDIGLRTNYSFTKTLDLVAEYTQIIMLNDKTNTYSKYRNAFKLGFLMKF